MKKLFLILIITGITLSSCSNQREVVMPFRNLLFSGERLFPVQNNDSKRIFRVWFNNGTSIDRVLTVSNDSVFNNQVKLREIGFLDKKNLIGRPSKIMFYKEKEILPNCGFDKFFEIVDSLDLIHYSNQDSFNFPMHRPFSLYVVEIKLNNVYNQFTFRTYYPLKDSNIDKKYADIEKLIFDQFHFGFYVK